MSSLRDDELSQKYFYAGCLGLPWLWIVHVMNYKTKTKKGSGALLGQEENRTFMKYVCSLSHKYDATSTNLFFPLHDFGIRGPHTARV